MQINQGSASPEQTLRVARMVVGALLGGLLTFAVVVIVLGSGSSSGGDALLVATAVVLGASVVASFVAGRVLVAHYRRRDLTDENLLAQAFFQTTLIRVALLEGPGFLCLVTYLLYGQRLALAGAAVCFALMLALFPTRASWDRFHAAVGGGEEGGGLQPH